MTTPRQIDAKRPDWSVEPGPEQGVVYVATGEAYLDEARSAARRLREASPGLRVCLITNATIGEPFWDDLVLVSNPSFGFRDKILMGVCPYERFVFLDTDTAVLHDISEIFKLLDRFDMAGHQLFDGHDCLLEEIPDVFPEFNSGVLAFRRSPRLPAFFESWMGYYDRFFEENLRGSYQYWNVGDQKSLRHAIYFSELRVAVLGPEYNFIPQHLDFASATVRILHGRGDPNIENLRSRLNARLGNRVYVPRLDAVIHNELSGTELRHLFLMSFLQVLRDSMRKLTPLALRTALRKSELVRRIFLRNRFLDLPSQPDAKWRRHSGGSDC